MSKVSVIIAAYNVEKYIESTVNSVISQTLKNIEIVVVDDCSTDGTYEKLEQFAALDKRIKLIRHSENKSAMAVRKTGIAHASGEYVMLLDGDDMLVTDACEKAYHAIVEENVDILQFDTEIFVSKGTERDIGAENGIYEYLRSIEHKVVSVSPCGLLAREQINGVINFTVWNKIYRRSLLEKANEHTPDEYMNIAEDVLFSFLVQYFARSFSYLPERLHRYRYGSGVTTASVVSDQKIEALAKSMYVYTYLKNWTAERGYDTLCREPLLQIRKQMMNGVTDAFFHKVVPSQRNHFIETVRKYCSVEDLVLTFSDCAYFSDSVPLDLVAQACTQLDMFSSRKTEAKTVGVYYYRVYNGGIENVLSTLTDLWVRSGYNVVLFTDKKPNKDDYYINPLVKRVAVPELTDDGMDGLEERIIGFRRAIIENGIDVMVYNAWVDPHILLDEMIIKSCGAKLIVHTHGMFCFDIANENGRAAYCNSALNRFYGLADSVVALTDVDVAWWRALGVRAFKTVNPIKLPLDVEPSQLTGNNILLVGRISGEKQVLDAIKIVELVKDLVPDVTLTIVGKGDDKVYVEQVRDYIRDNDLKQYVKMAGFDTNVLPFYQSSDVILSTSKFEGFGLVLMESKLCGLPLVSYELPNLDITRENRGMITVPQSDIKAAADAVVRILTDGDLKKKMGKEARESAVEMYSIDFAKLWNDIFTETMQPKSEPVPLYRLPPQETAINIAVDYYTRGIGARCGGMPISSGGGDWRYYEEQCRVLSKALNELSRSESYRVGLFITAIPRKINNWLKRRKKKS